MIRTFEPDNVLHKLVDYIWIVDFNFLADGNRGDIIMPLGHINIIFNYGSAYRLVGEKEEMVIPDAAVIGQMKEAKHVQYGQHLYQIGISLTPLGFIKLFHEPGLELTGRIVQVIDVDPDLDELYLMMMTSKDVEQRMKAINQFLMHKLALNEKDTGRIEEMLTYVEREYESLNIVSMAKFFGVSVSSLERFFKKYIGLTPKAYGNIVKFRKHVEDEGLRRDMQYHYYDQSHLIKTSKKFAGKTIKELEELPDELTLGYLWHGQQQQPSEHRC
ncbi:AraC family transcriptional regulator [Paenibacillus chitinolyticus]|uniref:helix-turn-helix domain-containing protein n=1 Tax=Paenibacillus chitinolyticus TaxID=79263 RepID=UPI0026E49912|nr:AraC family transcriptional regulator [Paenibacillus chitinolyticus]GKS12092.1 AraC family transcriptional regulator [Paenibacillus chitinolyticus]